MRQFRTSGLMSGDWKRNYGANCDTGMGESRRQTVQPRSLRSPRQSSTLLHRLLTAHGIAAYVLEPTSILVNRRARRAKTDRLDAEGMLRVLATWLAGDRQVCSMVRVPTPEEEDAKRPHREREHLVQERLRIENRIEALRFTQGIRKRPSLRSWGRDVAELRTGDGRELPCLLRIELERLRRRLVLALELIHEVEADRAEALAAPADDKMTQKIAALQRLRGIGPNFAAVLVREVLYRSSPTAVSSPATSASHPCPTRAAAWIATEASAERATRGPARRSSSSPGFGCATSRAVRSPHGSVSASACCRDARGGSPLWQWRGSC